MQSKNMQKTYYTIAEHSFCITHNFFDLDKILPSYVPFKNCNEEENLLFAITVDNTVKPTWHGEHIGFFPCNSAKFEVYRQNNSYRILIIDENNFPCAFLQTDEKQHEITITTRECSDAVLSFGLNNAIMLAYTICTSPHNTLLMHSSVVENNGKAYMFLGASGRGKSTHSDLWVKYIPNCTLINDDNPVLRISDDGTPIIYGSPWSGKRPIYKRVHYPIGGLASIVQSTNNAMHIQNIPSAFGIMLSSCSTMKFDKDIHLNICNTIGKVLKRAPVYILECRRDKEAAQVSSKTFGL